MALALGYVHPDVMLAQLTSSQVADWIAFSRLEQIGHPVYATEEEKEQEKIKAMRAKTESGLRALMIKQKGKSQ